MYVGVIDRVTPAQSPRRPTATWGRACFPETHEGVEAGAGRPKDHPRRRGSSPGEDLPLMGNYSHF